MAINESIKKLILPCAVMRNLVAFPGVPMTVDMEKGPAKRIFETAIKENDTVTIGDIAEYEIKPRLETYCNIMKEV